MKISILSSLLLVPAVAYAQNATATASYLQAVLAALSAANLTSLVGVASAIANTTDGLALLSSLATGNKTVFAPNNAAFANVSSDVSSNTTLLTQILSYHILNTTYTAAGVATSPNHTIARTALRGGGYSLPGNFTAPLVLTTTSSNATSFNIVQATDNFTAQGPAAAANLLVYIIPEVISLPPNISSIATTLFPSLAGVIQSTGLLAPLAAAPGLTVFAPNNAAIAGVAATLGSLNSTVVTQVLANHVINGSVAYSDRLASANYTSAGGQPFSFITNSSGSYVTSGMSTAKIVQSDIIINNGVVHLIDGVLVNTNFNATAAASAAAAAGSAAATSTEGNAPATATSNAATSAATTSKTSSAMSQLQFNGNAVLGSAFAVIGMVAGGGYLLI